MNIKLVNECEYTIRSELVDSDLTYIHQSLQQTYWAKSRSFEDNQTAFSNSRAFILTNPQNQILGFARVVTDYAIFAYLADVYIDDKHRGCGLGKFLIKHILLDPKLIKVKKFMLKTQNAQDLYAKFGFVVPDEYGSIMEKFNHH